MKNKKILFIVEGEKEELRIVGRIAHNLLDLLDTDYEVIPFKNPIYELYDAYKAGEYDNIVAYLHTEKGLKLEPNTLPKEAFSAVYLIFDFEPHYHKYSDETIKDLLSIFDNETENGKLYINYPTVESFYNLNNLPDEDFLFRVISTYDFKGAEYKKSVNLSTCLRKNKFTQRELCFIVHHNYNKVKYLLKCKNNEIDHKKILDIQLRCKKASQCIFVLNTFSLFVVDYNSEILTVIAEKIKK